MRSIFFISFLGFSLFGHSQQNAFNYLPQSDTQYQLIQHEHYSLAYSEKHEQAVWVAYELTNVQLQEKVAQRRNDFREDPSVLSSSASLKDYHKSGYDRGHLAAAADFAFSTLGMSQSFFMSNMSPQVPAFNRGVWKKLEESSRNWAMENASIYVICGGLLSDSCQNIGVNEVAVPRYFYKILLDYSLPGIKAIGFLMENKASEKALHSYVVSIDSIEILTGLDFFPELEDHLENQLESYISTNEWFSAIPQNAEMHAEEKLQQYAQCRGIAKSTGERCRISFGLDKEYCRHHQDQRN